MRAGVNPAPTLDATLAEVRATHPETHERLSRLDSFQQRAVVSDGPATLVQAQVGSGKTTVLVHKLLWLHCVQGVALRDVVVLTFTRRAADEVRARVRDLGLDAEDAWHLLGTFHSVARALLARDLPVHELGFSPSFEVLDSRGRDDLLERLIDEHALNVKYRARLSRRWERWRRGQRRFGNMKRDDDMGRLVALFAIEKQRRDLMDFDDLLDNAARLLPTHSTRGPTDGSPRGAQRSSQHGARRDSHARVVPDDATQRVSGRAPGWILIDELQDCGPEQLEFVRRLRGPQTRLFAVGDPDQSIYSWRGGSPRLFTGFGVRHHARVLDLPHNYRSTATIVEAAGALLGGRRLLATRPEGERIAVVDHHDPQSEAIYLAQRLAQLHAAGCPWSEFALLVRTGQQLVPLTEGLTRTGIPCAMRSVGEGPAVRWLHGLLRAALNDDARDARAALTHERYGLLTSKDLRRAHAWCESRGESGLAGLRAFLADAQSRPSQRKASALRAALAWCARLAELPAWLEAHGAEDWDARLLEHLELPLALGPTRSTQPRDLAEVTQWLAGLRATTSALDLARGAGSALSPRGEPRPRPANADTDAVQLMTIHASKGLEFRHVFVCGANNGLLPLASAWRKRASLAEERRLFFVALTRARDSVEFSWYRAPTRPDVRPEPSDFLSDLPQHCLAWLDAAALAKRGAEPSIDREQPSSSSWCVGDRVQHKKYGSGAVVAVEGARLRCAFSGQEEKVFSKAMCPLTRSESLP